MLSFVVYASKMATLNALLVSVLLLTVCSAHADEFDEYDAYEGAPTLLLNDLQITLSTRLLMDVRSPAGKTLRAYLGWLPLGCNLTYNSCTGDDAPSGAICLEYGEKMKLTITPDDDGCSTGSCGSVSCHKVVWDYHLTGSMDCFLLGDDAWYGGGERLHQRWPLHNDSRHWHPFVTGDPAHHSTGSVLENLWVTSSGFLIFVDRDVPLFLSFNESNNGKMCFSTSLRKHPFRSEDYQNKRLSYTVCAARNVKEAYTYATQRWMEKPVDIPDELMFEEPVWSTWARYKTDIDQEKVLRFAGEILENDFPFSHLEIDDKWQNCYGDLAFDTSKFPKPKEMIEELKDMGFRTTFWVHPFCNVECNTFRIGEEQGFWVKDPDGKPVIITWWDGQAGMLDVTNENAVQWYVSRLQYLKDEYGIDSFKFDAGEVLWLQRAFVLHEERARSEPNLYTQRYAEMAARLGGKVEVRSAWNVQHLPVFVRMYDKDSEWGYDNGLKTLIPTALHFSLMGYFFILPDMIGGNNYAVGEEFFPDRELYIRWLQANVFLPSMQFSITPWDYDDEVKRIAHKMVNLHVTYSSIMLSVAKQSVQDGTPIIRPLWWLSPDDPVAQNADTEFLVGNTILVAPVLEEGKRERDIFIPEGRWKDMLRGAVFEGPQTIYDYHVALSELPYFIKQG